MLEKILSYEEGLFFLINGSHSHFGDCVMWLFSGKMIWIPLAIFFIGSIFYKKKWRIWLPVLIGIILLIVCCDQFSSKVCKPYFTRFRPTHYPGIGEYVRTLYGYVGGKYGFISGHATNSFGFAAFTALLFRYRFYSIVIYGWALLMSYSRVYLGVHFVSDVVVGAIAGSVIGLLVYKLYRLYADNGKWNPNNERRVYSDRQVKLITITILSYIFVVTLFCKQLIDIL